MRLKKVMIRRDCARGGESRSYLFEFLNLAFLALHLHAEGDGRWDLDAF